MDPSITSEDLVAWSTHRLFYIMQAYTDQIEQKIVFIEHNNEELVQQMQRLHRELVSASKGHDKKHALQEHVESTMEVVSARFFQVWTTFRQVSP
jgi:hypothetical protein